MKSPADCGAYLLDYTVYNNSINWIAAIIIDVTILTNRQKSTIPTKIVNIQYNAEPIKFLLDIATTILTVT